MPVTEVPLSADRLYKRQFLLLCLSSFLFFGSFNLIIPELPSYLTTLGGADYKGYIIFLFTVTAFISRPFSGKLTDTIGRVPVMVAGAAVSAFCGFLYPFATGVFAFLILRFMHGFSAGFKPTGTSAYVADIVPVHRRGEAMGILSLSGSLGMASGPALGSWMALHFPLQYMFYAGSAMALLSVIVLLGMEETMVKKQRFHGKLLLVRRNDFFEPRVLLPGVILMFSVFSFGAVLTVIPDYSMALGMENKGLFFTFFTLSSLAVRLIAGKLSDRYGREVIVGVATLWLAGSMLFIAQAQSSTMLLTGAFFYGIGVGMNSPTIFAWAIDLSHEAYRGRAMATVYMALEAGIGIGALASGAIFDNETENIPYVFITSAIFLFLSFAILAGGMWHKRRTKKPVR